jgi:polar amino acid transport system substrate-binding protein
MQRVSRLCRNVVAAVLCAGLAFILAMSVNVRDSLADEPVRLGIGDWPPYFAEDLKHNGSFAYIVSEAFKAAGHEVRFSFVPWKRALAIADSGELDGSPGWKATDDRRKTFLFSDPVIVSTSVIFHLKRMAFAWRSLDDLASRRIGVTAGYSYGPDFDAAVAQKRLAVDPAKDDLTALKMLLAGRTDLVVMNRDVGLDIVRRQLPASEAAEITYEARPIDEQPSFLAIARSCPRAAQLLADFNRGLAIVKQQGLLEQVKLDMERGLFY